MAKKQRASSYELLANRIRAQINSPRAQDAKCTEIERLPDEREDDWERLLDDISAMEEVTVIPLDDGRLRLRWNPTESAE